MPSFRVPDSYSSSPQPSTPERRRDGAFNPFGASNPSTTPAGAPPSSAGSFTPVGPPPSSILGSSRLDFGDSNRPLQPLNFGRSPAAPQFDSPEPSPAFNSFGQAAGNKRSGLSHEFRASDFGLEQDAAYTHDERNNASEYQLDEGGDYSIDDISRMADEMDEDRYGNEQDLLGFDNSIPGYGARNTSFGQSDFRSSGSLGRDPNDEVASLRRSIEDPGQNFPENFTFSRIAKDFYSQMDPPEIREEDDLVLKSEALIARLYREGIRKNEDEQAHTEVTTVIPNEILKLWAINHERTKPHKAQEYPTAIGPGPGASGFAYAYFLGSALLSLHNPSEVEGKHSLKSVPQVLLEWMGEHHDPYPAQLSAILSSRPSPTHHRQFWNTVVNSLLRGRVRGVVNALQTAGWEHARQGVDEVRNPDGGGYSGRALINVEKVAGEMLEVLYQCPALREDWETTNSDWTLFRLKASQGLENLRRFAEGKDQPEEEPPTFEASNFGMFSMAKSYSGAARKAESRVPWEVYQNLTSMYNLMLGDVTSIVENAQDWCEATVGLMIWWSQPHNDRRTALGRSYRKQTKPPTPFGQLTEAFHLATSDSTDFHVNTADMIEVGLASVFEFDVESAFGILGSLSAPVSSATVEVASVTGWLPSTASKNRIGMSDSLDQDDMDLLGLNQLPSQQSEDTKSKIMVAYAEALYEQGRTLEYTDKNKPRIARESWEVAIEVLARLDSAERSEKEVGRLIGDLPLEDGPTVDKLWRLLNDIGMTVHSESVAEEYANSLSDHTHKYGEAIWYYSLAHKQNKVKDVLDLLISLSLLHSVAYPPQNELDDHLQRLISSPKAALTEISRLDYEAAKLIHTMLSGYATLRQFYTLRDEEVRNSSGQIKPVGLSTKSQAASALIAVITSSDDNIRGGLYDEERGAVVSVDFLLPLLGESMVFVNQKERIITSSQIDSLLKAIEDLQTVSERVYSACDEFFQTVVASTQGVKGSTPMDLLKKSTSSMSGTSSFSMVGSSMIASQLQKSIGGSGVLMKENLHRGWDWRKGLTAGMTSGDVLKILRYGLAKELARSSIMSFMDNAPNIKASTYNPDHPGGKKVHDTHAPPIIENPGPIASDSLAAESTNAHGVFSQNKNAEPLGVTGAHSTFANKDISGAEKLAPTDHASSRPDPTTTAADFTSNKMNLQPQPAPGYDREDEQLLRGNAVPAPGYVDQVRVEVGERCMMVLEMRMLELGGMVI
ncbi:hypothetical protein V496_02775 [Pseudogymnoascus sp. VKM F-4515 (FW-2607)]|nr:hypothetical protein V496_02775 [Pseudogymnoascus sp. VKM F-4515 (FW-2607)]